MATQVCNADKYQTDGSTELCAARLDFELPCLKFAFKYVRKP